MSIVASPQPLVSVVIPCFNHGRYLAECISSLRAQSEPRWEAIIVDDCSTDGETPALCDAAGASDPRVRVVHLPKNLGRSLARNHGVALARTEAVLPLDADDLIRADHLAATVPLLLARPDAGLVYTDYERFGDRRGFLRGRPFNLPRLYTRRYIWACALFRRSAWATTEGYRDAFRDGNEDFDFFLQLLEAGWDAVYVPRPLVLYRSHGGSWTQNVGETLGRVTATRLLLYQRHREAFDRHGATRYFLADTWEREALLSYRAGLIGRARRLAAKSITTRPWHRRGWRTLVLALLRTVVPPRGRRVDPASPPE